MNNMTKLLIALSLTVSACGGAPDASVSEQAATEQGADCATYTAFQDCLATSGSKSECSATGCDCSMPTTPGMGEDYFCVLPK